MADRWVWQEESTQRKRAGAGVTWQQFQEKQKPGGKQ